MIFNNNYYHALDRDSFSGSPAADMFSDPEVEQEIKTESGKPFTAKLGPTDLGKPGNPMQHQLQALLANIREGVGKIEFNFPGARKGTAQSPTPESYNKREREDMRQLLELNKMKTSVHATFGLQGFSGLSERGFNDSTREDNLREIKKAIDFAADATKGGAIVFHTGEWNRPIYQAKWNKPTGKFREVEVEDPKTGKKTKKKEPIYQFEGFPEEHAKATLYVADSRTGAFVDSISKDQFLFEPVFVKAEDPEAEKYGIKKVGDKFLSKDGKEEMKGDDWIDSDGRKVPKFKFDLDEKDLDRLFKRIPKFDESGVNFKVDKLGWDQLVERAKELEKEAGKPIPPEMLFARIHLEHRVLQAKGSSLFHARHYEEEKKRRDKYAEALKVWNDLEPKLKEKNELWKYMQTTQYGDLIPPDVQSPIDYLNQRLEDANRSLRYIHESSASADVQAKEAADLLKRVKPVHEVGIVKSADSIARAAIFAMEKYNQNRKHLDEPIYIAPENWHYTQFGSHPDEMIELIEKSRAEMVNQLKEKYGYSELEAKEKAKTHIKATIDVGHFNMWRQHYQGKEGEKPEDREKSFNKWIVDNMKKLAEKKILGHIHLSDNLGFDDEHLTPGTGNVPIKDIVEELNKAGIKDFIIEPGSFNAATVVHDTFSLLGSPIYKLRPQQTFASIQRAHFGYHNPAMYIVGAYSPSNEWVLWSEVPLE
ncbi:MAG TPA: TIM barrel protein [Candidatus Nanoarchaeia archaeon]|nr:TIM barrel protein [Candidatus Nanoarchaeia archaeon]